MGQPGGKGHVLSNTAPRPGAPFPAANQRQGGKFLEKKQHAVFVFIIQRCPNSGSWEAEEPSQGQGHQLFVKLVWHLFFSPWFMEMTACNAACMQRRWLMAILSVVVFPSRGQRSLPSCKKASLHPPILLSFDLVGKGLFLKLFCTAQVLSMNQVLKFISAY